MKMFETYFEGTPTGVIHADRMEECDYHYCFYVGTGCNEQLIASVPKTYLIIGVF
jgi:hypothetical protein